MAAPQKFAVMGNPVAHSKSPFIHRAFAAQFGIALCYDALLVGRDGFASALRAFAADGGRGVNVTAPFKEEAFALADICTERAQTARTVNTVTFDGKKIHGDNTDGAGLVRDLRDNLGVTLRNARVLIIGAGGAARGILSPLLAQKPARIHIANRTAAKAIALAGEFSCAALSGGGLETARGAYDLILHAAGPQGPSQLSPGIFADSALAYDLSYADGDTPFVTWAKQNHAPRTADGAGMLVEQAAESFFVWHGRRPGTAAVVAELRRA